MKQKFLAAAGVFLAVLLASAVFGYLYVERPSRTVRHLQVCYQRTERGMRVEQVRATMDHARGQAVERWFPVSYEDSETTPEVPAWDDKALPPAEARRLAAALRYTVSAFFLPVIFEFTFDTEGRLVGRHIYD